MFSVNRITTAAMFTALSLTLSSAATEHSEYTKRIIEVMNSKPQEDKFISQDISTETPRKKTDMRYLITALNSFALGAIIAAWLAAKKHETKTH